MPGPVGLHGSVADHHAVGICAMATIAALTDAKPLWQEHRQAPPNHLCHLVFSTVLHPSHHHFALYIHQSTSIASITSKSFPAAWQIERYSASLTANRDVHRPSGHNNRRSTATHIAAAITATQAVLFHVTARSTTCWICLCFPLVHVSHLVAS